jgi:hypothetical protein
MAELLEAVSVALDFAAVLAAVVASWFWYRASDTRVHRVSIEETFDYHDLNRVIVAINRNNLRNRQAALSSAVAAGVLALDLLVARMVS